MQKIDYDDLQNIDIKATNKLLIYIDSIIDIPKLYENINDNFIFFRDENSRLAFNSWLTMDYVTEEGDKFIESFLNKIPSNLNQLERIILRGKANSHMSLLEIKKVYGEYIIVRDILNNLDYKLWEPKLKGLMKEGEIFLARIGKALGSYRFIGDVNYLPLSVKSIFMENLLVHFNAVRRNDPLMDIRRYLKTNTLNIYRIYEESILNIKDVEYEEDYLLFFQLEEFESFLSSKSKSDSVDIKNHIHNLMTIYEYRLEDEEMNIKDIVDLDFKEFLSEAIEDDFIYTKEEFNSYVDTLKSYLGFLSSIEKDHKNKYKEILNISHNRFTYTQNMVSHSQLFNIDKDLVKITANFLDNDMVTLLKDFNSFLTIVDGENPKLTKKNKFIKRKDLYEINETLRIVSNPNSKAPNQKDYPLIDLFYFASLNLNLARIIDDRLCLGRNTSYFFRLKDEEKYALLCNYVLNGKFIEERSSKENIKLLDKNFLNYKDFLISINTLKGHPNILRQLEFLYILKQKKSSHFGFEITSFGKSIVNYLIDKNKKDEKPNILYFENLKKTYFKL